MDQVVLEEEFDENYEPTEEEILEYATFLGMDPVADKHLFWIARESLKAPLPKDWKPCQTEDGNIYYFNFVTGESIWDHPCDEHYKSLFLREKQKTQALAKAGNTGLTPLKSLPGKKPVLSSIPPSVPELAPLAQKQTPKPTAADDGGSKATNLTAPGALTVGLKIEHSDQDDKSSKSDDDHKLLDGSIAQTQPVSSVTVPMTKSAHSAKATFEFDNGVRFNVATNDLSDREPLKDDEDDFHVDRESWSDVIDAAKQSSSHSNVEPITAASTQKSKEQAPDTVAPIENKEQDLNDQEDSSKIIERLRHQYKDELKRIEIEEREKHESAISTIRLMHASDLKSLEEKEALNYEKAAAAVIEKYRIMLEQLEASKSADNEARSATLTKLAAEETMRMEKELAKIKENCDQKIKEQANTAEVALQESLTQLKQQSAERLIKEKEDLEEQLLSLRKSYELQMNEAKQEGEKLKEVQEQAVIEKLEAELALEYSEKRAALEKSHQVSLERDLEKMKEALVRDHNNELSRIHQCYEDEIRSLKENFADRLGQVIDQNVSLLTAERKKQLTELEELENRLRDRKSELEKFQENVKREEIQIEELRQKLKAEKEVLQTSDCNHLIHATTKSSNPHTGGEKTFDGADIPIRRDPLLRHLPDSKSKAQPSTNQDGLLDRLTQSVKFEPIDMREGSFLLPGELCEELMSDEFNDNDEQISRIIRQEDEDLQRAKSFIQKHRQKNSLMGGEGYGLLETFEKWNLVNRNSEPAPMAMSSLGQKNGRELRGETTPRRDDSALFRALSPVESSVRKRASRRVANTTDQVITPSLQKSWNGQYPNWNNPGISLCIGKLPYSTTVNQRFFNEEKQWLKSQFSVL